ncbi:MAG: dipeptide epimerase [Gemmatimonadetes bacterium]|nr:dipeptide epimerase [Gemmatimonadota bacterium]
MRLSTETVRLDLIHPFRIAREVSDHKHNVLVRISDGELTGTGEAAPSRYYGEDAGSVMRALERVPPLLGGDPFELEETTDRLASALPGDPAARAAVDIAMHDLAAQRLGVPLYRWLGLDPAKTPVTSFTIGIDEPATVRRKVREAAEYPALKIKLGSEKDLEIMRAIRDETDARIRIDANAGWTADQAVEMVGRLSEFGVELVEQPLPPGAPADWHRVREAASMPVFADESVLVSPDVPAMAGLVDGVNIKLMKCGGVREALRLIHTARAHGMGVMIGCMIETSVAITAAAHLSPLADYADLDGNLLISNDPFTGATVRQGRLLLPDGPGIGIAPRS